MENSINFFFWNRPLQKRIFNQLQHIFVVSQEIHVVNFYLCHQFPGLVVIVFKAKSALLN